MAEGIENIFVYMKGLSLSLVIEYKNLKLCSSFEQIFPFYLL